MIVHCLYDSGPGSESEEVPSESEFMCVLSYYLQTWGQLHQNVIYYYCYYFKITSITIIGTMLDQCNLLYYYYLLILLLCYSIEPQHEQQLPLQPGKITVLISLNLSSLLISHLSLVPHLYHCFNHVALTLFLISYSIDPSIHDSSASPSTPRRAPPAVPPTPTKEGAADDDSSSEDSEAKHTSILSHYLCLGVFVCVSVPRGNCGDYCLP